MGRFSRRKFLGGLAVSSAAVLTAPKDISAENAEPNEYLTERVPASTLDFRYGPRLSQAKICFPDDPKKSLVGQAGDLRYGFAKAPMAGMEEFATVCRFSLAEMQDDRVVRQWLEAPQVPLIHTGTQNVSIFPRNPKDPYSTNWLFGIQQEVAPNTVLTVNYTGNKVQHLQAGVDFAAINLNPANVVTQARPLSGFANENLDADNLYSYYNALQVQLRRNIGRLNFEVNYTWSHEIDDLVNVFSGWSDPFNPNGDRGSGDWDVRHNLTGSAVYSLPDLKGSSSWLRGIAGGWRASSILQTRSGLPENIQLISGFFGLPMRPNYVPGQRTTLSSANWPNGNYNLNAFTVPAGYHGTWGSNLGDVGRNALRAPAFFQWDLSGMKNFPITERIKLQFRADLFNILNHPNFTNPDGGICTSFSQRIRRRIGRLCALRRTPSSA